MIPPERPKRTSTGFNQDYNRAKRRRDNGYDDDDDDDARYGFSANYRYSGGNRASRACLRPRDYTVGWVCALPIERTAAEAMLDETHEPLAVQSGRDTNVYTLGRIGRHNVVIAGLPSGHYGLNNATRVANNMLWTFPSIDRRLMVGIGGAAPDLLDIRLGDVVVSSQVIHYDFGKAMPNGHFQTTATSTRPPESLLNTIASLQSTPGTLPARLCSILDEKISRNPDMAGFRRPTGEDVLYEYSYDHVVPTDATCDACDARFLQPRAPRPGTDPAIHYGVVASANQVMRSGRERKRVTERLGVACFEMEAAGLMDDSVGCLVIRGICDYSDSHKNKTWQRYAAAVAAACATEVLHRLPNTVPHDQLFIPRKVPDDIPTTRQDQTLSGGVPEQRTQLLYALDFDQLDSRHDNIEHALNTTCEWFLRDEAYRAWLEPSCYPSHHGFLWISGKPGSGKSTLMKFIYGHVKNMMGPQPDTAVVSFFFNARGVELEKSTLGLYRSLILQILTQFHSLKKLLDEYIPRRNLTMANWNLDQLERLFQRIVGHLEQRRLFCFIDALDECDQEQVQTMVDLFAQLGNTAAVNGIRFYVCFSSRPYPHVDIESCLRRTLEEQPGHMQDMQKYIEAKLRSRSISVKLWTKICDLLLHKAGGVFMWVVLAINILNKELRHGRAATLERHLESLPSGLTDLFRSIVLRDTENQEELLLSIQWILYAKRPLGVEEYYYALHMGLYPGPDVLSAHDADVVTKEQMELFILSSSKGLAEITKTKHPVVQFIHESVRDFLLRNNGVQYIMPRQLDNFEASSHDQLKRCCQFCLRVDLGLNPRDAAEVASLPVGHARCDEIRKTAEKRFPFLQYATTCLFYHADAAQTSVSQQTFLDTIDVRQWLRFDRIVKPNDPDGLGRRHNLETNLVYLFAELGWARLLELLLARVPGGRNLVAVACQEEYVYPLIAASANGHGEVVKLLLRTTGVDVNCRDGAGRTALVLAAEWKRHDVFEALVAAEDLDVDFCDKWADLLWPYARGRPQSEAVKRLRKFIRAGDNEPIVRLDAWDVLSTLDSAVLDQPCKRHSRTLLMWASLLGKCDMVHWLLKRPGCRVNATDSQGWTALALALCWNRLDVIKLLLAAADGIDVNIKDHDGRTALHTALVFGRRDTVTMLASAPSVDLEAADKHGMTPLALAAIVHNSEALPALLAIQGLDVNARDKNGRTPLSLACDERDTEYNVKSLLGVAGIDINSRDDKGWTPLMWAAHHGRFWVVKQLLADRRCDGHLKNSDGKTALDIALGRCSDWTRDHVVSFFEEQGISE